MVPLVSTTQYVFIENEPILSHEYSETTHLARLNAVGEQTQVTRARAADAAEVVGALQSAPVAPPQREF